VKICSDDSAAQRKNFKCPVIFLLSFIVMKNVAFVIKIDDDR
jgi:hypothetical protein